MKRLALLFVFLIAAAGYAFFQTRPPAPQLAAYMPGGAMLYLEVPDFGRLLREWDSSQVKTDWLGSANYAIFSRSNLFSKLNEVYGQYGEAAGLRPGLKSLIEIAGSDSALALYDIPEVEFLYVSRIVEADLAKSALWAVRTHFEERTAGGVPFYLRTDPASKRTVAFAFTKGYLILATRDDLVAQSLELIAGGASANIAADRWYRDAVAQSTDRGELRLVMNLELLVKSVYFRSYWVQRNVSSIRSYWTGVNDVKRADDAIVETRAFLRAPGSAPVSNSTIVTRLQALVPPEAGVYKASEVSEPSTLANLIVNKIIGVPSEQSRDWRNAPDTVSADNRAGSEDDLETRIDEQPLPADPGVADSLAAVRSMVEKGGARALLLVQSSVAEGAFVRTPSVIVLESATDWNRDLVRTAMGDAAGRLWTTSHLGAGWTSSTVGRHSLDRLDGLGGVFVASDGPLLFLGNDAALLAAVLDRTGAPAATTPISYAAGFRHTRERANYQRVMEALDFTSPALGFGFVLPDGIAPPSFFSRNIASLSRALSKVGEIHVTQEERGAATIQRVVYRLEQ
jgi:hypothetical protein